LPYIFIGYHIYDNPNAHYYSIDIDHLFWWFDPSTYAPFNTTSFFSFS
jgi:hypothetical protein